jgi:thiamine-phosphate pyrophosphorylase
LKSLADCLLYAFVDMAYFHGRPPVELARQLCEGGADIIQLRAKRSSAPEVARMADELVPVLQPFGVPLVINDHLDAALQTGAHFCHLGQEDFFDGGYRHVSDLPWPGKRIGIGLSTHAPEQARRALEAGPDYIAIGPVYATGTKPEARPVTLDYVRWASAHVTIPWFAIGGIHEGNLDEVLAAGARRVCVVSAILNASDVSAACRGLKQRLRANAAA